MRRLVHTTRTDTGVTVTNSRTRWASSPDGSTVIPQTLAPDRSLTVGSVDRGLDERDPVCANAVDGRDARRRRRASAWVTRKSHFGCSAGRS